MSNIRQYMAWTEKRIGQLVIAEGLHCGLLGVVQGPLTLTFRVRLLRPSPTALRKLLGMGPALGAALQCTSVRVVQGPDAIHIEVPSPLPRTPSGHELAERTRGLTVCVGYDSMRRPVHVDLRQHGAFFWVGPSRRGKTQSMKCTLFAVIRQVQSARLRYVIVSQKRKDWAAFEPAAGCMGVVSDPAEGQVVLEWTVRQLETGLDHTLIVVCDDLVNLLKRAPAIADSLAEIASMGAGLGVHLLAGTQTAGSKAGSGGAAVEANVTARIVYKSSNAAGAARDAGQGGAGLDQLTAHKGDALLILDGEPQRIATGYADDRDILQLQAEDLVVAPWRFSTGSQEPTQNRSEPLQEPVSTREEPLRTGSTPPPTDSAHGGHVEEGTENRFPVLQWPIEQREPTSNEAHAIRQMYADGESISALCRTVYGHKNGKTFAWIKRAVEDAGIDDDVIDLSTEAGRHAYQELMGDIDWKATREQYKDRRFLN